ncbi:hypothetical protein ACFLXU_00420 [Chloroflexota bacterium]
MGTSLFGNTTLNIVPLDLPKLKESSRVHCQLEVLSAGSTSAMLDCVERRKQVMLLACFLCFVVGLLLLVQIKARGLAKEA